MSGKGNPYRFTLQFNEKDHRQRFVADLLNDGMGRQKAQYITDAILHYINCVQNPDIEQDKDERLRQKIELMFSRRGKGSARPTCRLRHHLPKNRSCAREKRR